MFRHEVADRGVDAALVNRFAFDLKLLVLASHFGFRRISESPVKIDYQFGGTTNLRAVFAVLWDTTAIYYRLRLLRWYGRFEPRGRASWWMTCPPLSLEAELAAEEKPPRSAVRQAASAGVLLVVAGGMTGILNVLFNVVVARGGGVSAYGAIGPLLTLGVLAGLLATGLQYGVARVAALAPRPAGELVRMAFRAVLPWVLPTLILALLAVPIASFLNLSSPLPVLIVTLLAAVSVAGAAVSGLLLGLSRFRVIASLGVGSAVLRLVLGFFLGHGKGAVDGSILASVVPVLGSMLLGLAILLYWRRPRAEPEVAAPQAGPEGIGHTGLVGALIAGALWTIWAVPVLFARHALSSVAAGDFAASQLLAGGIIWVTAPLVTAFYPTIVRHRHRSPILIGAIGTLGIALVGFVALTTVGPILIERLYGSHFSGSRGLLLVLAMSATATACATFACWAALARRRAMRLTLAALGLALLLELGWDGLVGHTDTILAAGPFLALALSGGTVGTAAIISRRRADPLAPGALEPSSVGPPSSQIQIRSDP
jgi:O-antigen/teichoic acid export membrane protein